MRNKILALEEERIDPALVNTMLADSDSEAQADEQDVVALDNESEQVEADIDQADHAGETAEAVTDTVMAVTPAEGEEAVELTVGGSNALAAALEHMVQSLGISPQKARAMVALEGLALEQRPAQLVVSMESIGETLKKVGQAIWKILQKIADWLVTLYHKMVLSVKRMRARLDAAKRAAAASAKNGGGHEIQNRTLRNFFSYRGVDIETHAIAHAIAQNTNGSEKLWDKVKAGAEKAVADCEYFLKNPGSDWSFARNTEARSERAKRQNEFASALYSQVINNEHFSSERFKSGGVHFVRNQRHLPFGNYVMSFTLVDGMAPMDEKHGYVFGEVRSTFAYEPPTPVGEHRQPLYSLSSQDIDTVLNTVGRDLGFIEKIAAEASKIQAQMRRLARDAEVKAAGQYMSYLPDKQKIESFSIAHGIISIGARFAQGPLGGLSIYLLKSAHYALHLAERSLKLNATGVANGMGGAAAGSGALLLTHG